jgi:putative tricarboxylic transport membrane protein
VVGARGLTIKGPPIEAMRLRPILCVLAALLVFGFAMDGLGLIFSAVALTVISALAQRRPNWRDTLLLAGGMTAFCAIVFVLALKQPLTLFGN